MDASVTGSVYGVLVSWHWVLGDGSTFDGPVPPLYSYASTPAATTAVRLTVTDNRGCSHTYTGYPFVLATRSAQTNGATVFYPNPAAGWVTLVLTQLTPGPVTVQLLNSLGQQARSYSIVQNGRSTSQQLDVRGLAAGVYTVQVITHQGAFRNNLVVQ